MGLKDQYEIVGIGYAPQGHVPGRTALSFYVEACANAIKDAGPIHHMPDVLFKRYGMD